MTQVMTDAVLTQDADSPEVGRAGAPTPVATRDARAAEYVALFDDVDRAGEPQWLGAQRRASIENFATLGFPTTKNEDWHFTSVASLLEQGTRKIIIDMANVTHIDSTGIGRCISCLNKCMQTGAKLHMAGANGQVREAFRVTRLDRMFKFFDQVPDAEAAFV